MTTDDSNEHAQQQPPEPGPAIKRLGALAGEWRTEGSHRLLPGVAIRGRVAFEWLAGGHFLIQRSDVAHPDFPDSIAIIGCDEATGGCTMHYFDSRGIERVYETSMGEGVWKLWRDSPGFSQRFTGAFSDDGNTIHGRWELSRDGSNWEHDFDLTYTKTGP